MKDSKYSMILFLVLALIQLATSQQCKYPFQRCLCISSTPLCRCSSITTDSTLNVSSSYKSHLVFEPSYGCLPCPYGCLECSTLTYCISCQDEFILINNTCINCPINCKKCKTSLSIPGNEEFLNLICTDCKFGFYIDSQSRCQICPLQGSLICTVDSITSCLPSYWLDNNGAICVKCDPNCKQCSSTTKCSVCIDGFYLSSFKCLKCMSQCLTCSNSSSCLKCLKKGFYYDQISSSCLKCGQNCIQCTSLSNCTICDSDNSLQFTLINGNCSITSQVYRIANCKQNKNISSTLSCTRCQTGYFQQNSSNSCNYGCSILCSECTGAHFGLCTQCKENSFLYNRHCLPRNNINNGAAYQLYLTAFHNSLTFNSKQTKPILMTRTNNNCLKESIMVEKFLTIDLSYLQAYRLQISWKLYILGQKTDGNNYINYYTSFKNNEDQSSQNIFKCQNFLSNDNCSYICVSKQSFIIDNIVKYKNSITFYSVNQNNIGISEVLVTAYRCGGISGSDCLQCSSINLCTKCVNPTYYLFEQTCVQKCPPNYFIYEIATKCFKVCPYGTFPSSNQTNQLCQKCPSQCRTCLSSIICLACNKGYYLNQQMQYCVKQCPNRYFANQFLSKCQKCLSPCFECLSNSECLSCSYGFYDSLSHTCSVSCKSGYYGNLSNQICQKCQYPCQTCQFSSKNCIKCLQTTFGFNGYCLSTCPEGYFDYVTNESKSCQPCDSTCSRCKSQDICQKCLIGFLLNHRCQFNCPLGMYGSILQHTCKPCHDHCLSCSSFDHCSICKKPYILNIALFQCVTLCERLSFPQIQQYQFIQQNKTGQFYICRTCSYPCQTCINSTHCLSCISLFLLGNSCVSECNPGTFSNQDNLTCVSCPQKCLQCISLIECTKCIPNLILISGKCLVSCPLSYYFDSAKSICVQCRQNCQVCLNGTYCQKCSIDYFKSFQGQCLEYCQKGYWQDFSSRQCIKCPNFCQDCLLTQSNLILCSSCQLPYLYSQMKCVLTCQITYFSYGGVCQKCLEPCQTCNSPYDCNGCLPNFGFQFLGQCVPSCPLGYYGKYVQKMGKRCLKCPSQCLQCYQFNKEIHCEVCRENYTLLKINDTCLTIKDCQNYKDIFGFAYFASSFYNLCLKCSQHCKSCINQRNNCSQCTKGFYLLNNSCLAHCPYGTYKNIDKCLQCNQKLASQHMEELRCKKCINNSLCLSCYPSFYLFVFNSSYSQCMKQCPHGFYGINSLCYKCSYPCMKCNSSLICTVCDSGYLLLNETNQSRCIDDCPSGFYMGLNSNLSLECLRCSLHCLQCQNQEKCAICGKGFFLFNGICLQDCPISFYRFYGGCSPCMFGCKSCIDGFTCNNCIIGFLYESQCINYCPYGLIQTKVFVNGSENYECISCHQNCKTCKIKADICLSCHQPLYLHLDKCLIECPSGSYPSPSLRRCITCTKPCQTCINSESCQTCIYGYILYAEKTRKQCVKGPLCPNSYYLDVAHNYCKMQCNKTNKQYSQTISKTCSLRCPQGFTMFEENMTCLHSCPGEDTYVSQQKKCEKGKSVIQISQNLPYLSCKISDWYGLLKIFCYFSFSIQNIQRLASSNLEIEKMKILSIKIYENRKGFQILVDTLQSKRFIMNQWMTVSIRPRFYFVAQRRLSSRLSLFLRQQQGLKGFPVQNSDASILIKNFNFYNSQKRNTAFYLDQLAKGITLACLIIWVFCLLKNKKSGSTIWVIGLQWLFLISRTQLSNFPPNLQSFLLGFKYSCLIFDSNTEEIDFSDLNRLWGSHKNIKIELFTPFNILDQKTIGASIVYIISGYLLLYFSMLLMKLISRKLIIYFQNQQKRECEQNSQDLHKDGQSDNQVKQQESMQGSKRKAESISVSCYSKMKQKVEMEQRAQSKDKSSVTSKSKKYKSKPIKEQTNVEMFQDLQKKLQILLSRFQSNYLYHFVVVLSLPTSLVLFTQIQHPHLVGIVLALIVSFTGFLHLGFTIRSLLNDRHTYFKSQGIKFYILFHVQQYIIGFLGVFGKPSLFFGSTAIVFLLNIYTYCLIFNPVQWKLRFYGSLELMRILIISLIFVVYLKSEFEDGEKLYFYGWLCIVSIIVYILMLAVSVSRDFFQQQKLIIQQLAKEERKKTGSLLSNQLLKQKQKTKIQLSSKIVMQFESEQSFFEDESEISSSNISSQIYNNQVSNQDKSQGKPCLILQKYPKL